VSGASSHLAIILPGRAYGAVGAAIRIPVLVLVERGATVVDISYPSVDAPPAPGTAAWASFRDGVRRQVASAVDAARPDRVTFVAKSLGTGLLAEIAHDVGRPSDAAAIWLTPLFGEAAVREGAAGAGLPSLIVAGRADPWHDEAGVDHVSAALGAQTLLIDGADHSLEHTTVRATISTLRSLALATAMFLDARGGRGGAR